MDINGMMILKWILEKQWIYWIQLARQVPYTHSVTSDKTFISIKGENGVFASISDETDAKLNHTKRVQTLLHAAVSTVRETWQCAETHKTLPKLSTLNHLVKMF